MNMGRRFLELLGVGVEGCPSKFSAHLWFHGDLDGAAYVFFTLVWAAVGKLPKVFSTREALS